MTRSARSCGLRWPGGARFGAVMVWVVSLIPFFCNDLKMVYSLSQSTRRLVMSQEFYFVTHDPPRPTSFASISSARPLPGWTWANSEMWDGYGTPHRFSERPQVDQRLPGILAIPRSVAQTCSAPRSPRIAETAAPVRGENFAGSWNPTTRSGSANSWLKVPVLRRLVEKQNGLQLTYEPVTMAGRRCWP